MLPACGRTQRPQAPVEAAELFALLPRTVQLAASALLLEVLLLRLVLPQPNPLVSAASCACDAEELLILEPDRVDVQRPGGSPEAKAAAEWGSSR